MKRVEDGYFLGVDLYETARIVGGILCGRGLHDGKIVYLAAGNHVEREGAAVGLRAGHGAAIDPYVVVALLQAAHHDKLVVDEAHARYTAYHLAGIRVLCALDLLGRHIVDHIGTAPGLLYGGGLGVGAAHGGHRHAAQLLVGHGLCLLGGVGAHLGIGTARQSEHQQSYDCHTILLHNCPFTFHAAKVGHGCFKTVEPRLQSCET